MVIRRSSTWSKYLRNDTGSTLDRLLQSNRHLQIQQQAMSASDTATHSNPSLLGTTTTHHAFSNSDASDITLRSSDNIDFHVYKIILSLASPVFKDMFSLPQPSTSRQNGPANDKNDGTGIITLSEDSQSTERFLMFCYPSIDPELQTLEEVQSILEMMRKYDVGEVKGRLVRILMSPKFVEREPVRVFAIACRYGLEAEARLAAKYTLGHSLLGPFSKDLEHISAATYHRLLEYHQNCGKAAHTLAINLRWLAKPNWVWFRCSNCAPHDSKWWLGDGTLNSSTQWFIEYMERAREVLKDRPVAKQVSELSLMAPSLEKAAACHFCRPTALSELKRFADVTFASEIDKVTSEVELTIDC